MTTAEERSQGIAERRAHIVAAARDVFLAKGFARTTIRDLADAAAVKTSAIWSHFSTKEDIFVAAVLDPLEQEAGRLVDRLTVAAGDDEETRERVFAQVHEEMAELMAGIAPQVAMALFSNPELGRRFYEERLGPIFDQWLASTRTAMRHWPRRAYEARTALLVTWGMHFGMAFLSADRPRRSTGRAGREIADLLAHGVVRVA